MHGVIFMSSVGERLKANDINKLEENLIILLLFHFE